MDNGYANLALTRSIQAIQGGEKYKVKKLDFDTSCPCQITACDGGTIHFCAPVSFDPPIPHPPWTPGNMCNYGFNIEADNFIAKTSYKLADNTSTCATEVGETRALSYFADATGAAGTPVLSTVLENNPLSVGAAYIVINSPLDQPFLNPNTSNNGMILIGGELDRTKNILIHALGAAGGSISLYAHDNILLSALTPTSAATGKILGNALNEINLNCSVGPMNLSAHEDVGVISNTKSISLTADENVNLTAGEGGSINGVAGVDINLTATTRDVVLSAVGSVDAELVGYARDAVRWIGDIADTPAVVGPPAVPAISYPYASAFTWVQHGEIGHSGSGYWALPDEGQRVMTNAPVAGGTQTFPNPPPAGIKLWSCNFNPQGEQLTNNASFSHAGFRFVSAISDITGTAGTGDRNWTCTSSMIPDGDDLVVDAGMGTRPDPINATYKSEIGSVALPITKIEATTVNAVTSTVSGDIGCTNLTATGRVTGTRVNIGMGYAASGAPGTPPAHNYGAPGDQAGDIAFQTFTNGIDFYCCFQDYEDAPTPGVDRIWWRSPRFNQNF